MYGAHPFGAVEFGSVPQSDGNASVAADSLSASFAAGAPSLSGSAATAPAGDAIASGAGTAEGVGPANATCGSAESASGEGAAEASGAAGTACDSGQISADAGDVEASGTGDASADVGMLITWDWLPAIARADSQASRVEPGLAIASSHASAVFRTSAARFDTGAPTASGVRNPSDQELAAIVHAMRRRRASRWDSIRR